MLSEIDFKVECDNSVLIVDKIRHAQAISLCLKIDGICLLLTQKLSLSTDCFT